MLGRPYYIFVDTDYRLNGTSADFDYKIDIPSDIVYDSVAVMQCSIPKSYYLVRAPYNTFTITENGLSATVTMTPGNYSFTSFRIVLSTLLNAASPRAYTYTITQPNPTQEASTGKYTFTVSGNAGVQPIITFPSSSWIYLQMGFNEASTNTFVANTLTSSNVVNFAAISGFVIKSNMVTSRGNVSIHGNGILQEILNFNTTDYSNISFQNANVEYSAKACAQINGVAHFTITDLDELTLDFNSGSVNFSIVLFKHDESKQLSALDTKMRWYQDLQK